MTDELNTTTKPPLDGPDWLPMSSAPHDGTRIWLRMVHFNHRFREPWEADRWREACAAEWTDFNTGGWTWHGICGQPDAWMPMEPSA